MFTIETLAIVFSIIYVLLAAKQNIWCWPASILSVILYAYICYSTKLYMESGLQIFYLIMSVYGLWNWSRNKQEKKLVISEWSTKKHLIIIVFGSLMAFLIGFYFSTYTDAEMPILDSFTTIFSVFATFMVAKKILGNWLYWIVIDMASIYLYDSRGLKQTALLFIIYTTIAVFGYFSWLKKIEDDV